MLNGDGGGSNTDPYAAKETSDNNWVKTGPYVMIVGAEAKSMMQAYPRDPKADPTKQYVMWPGTPYEHLMLPVKWGGPRPHAFPISGRVLLASGLNSAAAFGRLGFGEVARDNGGSLLGLPFACVQMGDSMILYPAIDLKDGQCVRLRQGLMDEATVFNESPADQARQFAEQGFQALHVVDLNGAFEGRSVNADAVSAILASITIPVQLGGGIRSLEAISLWLSRGVARVILGTAAVRNPSLVKEACARFPGKIAVGIDAKDGCVAVQGWAETSEIAAVELARRFADTGVSAIIYTDISRDGMMTGLNLEATAELARSVSIPVIASGGLAGIDDVKRLVSPAYAMIAGAITGRALYDGRLDPKAALDLIKQSAR
jgi:phosphoribosylformimino-5-aminoimidazole carboxamide ribotide isomerase